MIIRWICEKCDKKWIYPIEKCPYCKGQIDKQKGTKLKIIGITKVLIPSPMHPIIPYNILLLEDEHGNRIPKKTMKEFKVGEDYVQEKAKSSDAVAIVKIKYDIYEAINESLEILNENFKAGDKILIKPSIITAAYPYQAATTNPEFFNALLKVLFEKGINKEDIIVAEQALIGSETMDAASKAGILDVCKKNDVKFADISKGPFEEIKTDSSVYRIYKEALGRKIINAPMMETNFQIGISGALENLSRLADKQTQREMYYLDINHTLPKLKKLLPDVLTVADASNGMQGQGPLLSGEPAFLNLVIAGRNPSYVDKIFCEATMIDIPDHILNSGVAACSIEVVGTEIDALKYPIKQPNKNESPHPDIKLLDFRSCPECLNRIYNLTSKLVGVRGQQITLLTGPAFAKEDIKKFERLVALGDCAIKRLNDLKLSDIEIIDSKIDQVEQLLLLKKILVTEGRPSITPVDKVKSKMQKLLSKVIG